MEIAKMKIKDYVNQMKNEELFEMLSDAQKRYIFDQVRFQNVKEDVEGQLDQNPDFDFENYTDEQIELLVNDVARRYVFEGEGDNELPYYTQLDNLIEDSSYYAEQYNRD